MKKTAHPPFAAFVPLVMLEIIIGSSLAALAFLLLSDLSNRVLGQEIQVIDQSLSHLVYSFRTPALTQIMLGISFLGGVSFLLVSSAVVFLLLLWKKYRREAVLFLFTFAAGFFLNLVMKYSIARVRPDMAPLIQEIFYSYPSGHSMNSFVFYSLVSYLTYHFTRNVKLSLLVTFGSILLIISIGISRVYLGVHYPSDVAAGFLAGAGWFLVVLVIDRTLKAFWFSRRKS
jgi:membrane-associated phospholipid phosphatase